MNNKLTEVTAIEMTITANNTKWYISIDAGYILISSKPHYDLTDEDYSSDDWYVISGYDRYDGEDYYKDFPIKKVVRMITRAIKINRLHAGKLTAK